MSLDILTASDPEVMVYLKGSKTQSYTFIGKTETIDNNANPDFTKFFTIDYFFEKEQCLKFVVNDVDAHSVDHIGDCEFTISKLMTSSK